MKSKVELICNCVCSLLGIQAEVKVFGKLLCNAATQTDGLWSRMSSASAFPLVRQTDSDRGVESEQNELVYIAVQVKEEPC